MSVRYYLCPFVGVGTIDDPFRPLVKDVLPAIRWQYWDGRQDQTKNGGVCLCFADVSDGDHSTLAGTTNVTYCPFEDDAGNVLADSAAVGQLSTPNRNTIQSFLESRHIPTNGITLADSLYTMLIRVFGRFRVRSYLMNIDYTELLDNTVSSIPAAKRTAIRNRLEPLGFDFAGITGGTTIRTALVMLINQEISLRT